MTEYRSNRIHNGFLDDPEKLLKDRFYTCYDIHKCYTYCV